MHPDELPQIIAIYIAASNTHNVESILACFSDDAVARDEKETFHGKKSIKDWIVKTIEKYKFQLKPLRVNERDAESVVEMEVSGTFPGSPITLDYRFGIASGKISALTID